MQSTKKGAASAIIVACSMVLASGMAPPAAPVRAVAPADIASLNVRGAPLTSMGGMGSMPKDRYGLGVVPVPPPPGSRGMPTAASEQSAAAVLSDVAATDDAPAADDDPGVYNAVRCPDVRAVVLGESSEDSFAVVNDRVLHRGQALSQGGSRLVVQDLAAKQVTFVRGDPSLGAGPASVVRCALQNYR